MFSSRYLKKLMAGTISTLILYTSPGLQVYSVLANGVASSVSAVKMNAPTLAPVSVIGGMGLNAAMPLTGNNGISLGLASVLPTSAQTPVVRHNTAASALHVEKGIGVVTAVAVTPVAPVAATQREQKDSGMFGFQGKRKETPLKSEGVRGTSRDIYAALKDFGPISRANTESARSFGSRIHGLLTGQKTASRWAAPVSAQGSSLQGLRHFGDGFLSDGNSGFQARPAGGESIGAAVRAHNGIETSAPVEKEDEVVKEEGSGPVHRAPLAARVFAAIVAAAPGVLIGLPLLAGGYTVAGSLLMAASLGLVTMPFFGEGTSKVLRVMPGVLVGSLGLWTLGSALLGGSGIVMGALVTLGGWGLIRFGQSKNKEYFDEEKVLTAFFGALAAVAGAGLVVLTPAALLGALAGWLPFVSATSVWLAWGVTGATWLSYPLAAMLLMHLPGWIGEGIAAGVRGIWESFHGVHRVLGSTGRDTLLHDRLVQWSEAKLELSIWNVFKVGAVWVPVILVEGTKAVVSLVSGIALGVLQAPTMFLWGAADSLAKDSRINKFLAAWNTYVFYTGAASKKSAYNKMIAKLVPVANSENALVSLLGAVGLNLAQAGWFLYTIVATPFRYLIGFFRAFTQTGGEYDSARHSPDAIRGIQKGDSPFEKPELAKKPVSDLIPPGLFAAGLALVPMYFFGMPALSMPIIGISYLVTGLTFASMPLLPGKTPKLVRQIPGFFLMGMGVLTMATVPYLTLGSLGLMTVLTSHLFWMGAVAALSGLGFVHNITKLAEKGKKRWHSVDDPEYIGAYFGALGVMTGIGLAFSGVTGWVTGGIMAASYLSSLLLLMHLPRWVWEGVGTALSGAWRSVKSYHKLLNFWREDTRFYKNLKDQADYHLDGNLWSVIANGTWLSLIWVPTWLMQVAEYAAALALGAATGVLRAPVNWAWGAAYGIAPQAKLTRFIAGFAKSLADNFEGSKASVFDKWVRGILPAMSGRVEPSGRPTLKAVAAFGLARVLQILWFARLILWSPVIVVRAIIDGVRNASGEKDKDDKTAPDELF